MTGRAWAVVLLGIVLIVTGGAVFVRCEASPPLVSLAETADELVIGAEGIAFDVVGEDEDSGIKSLEVRLRHANGEAVLGRVDPPGNPMVGGLSSESTATVSVRIDPKALGLAEGDAILVADATDWSWANLLGGNATTLEVPVSIDQTAPRVSVNSGLTYVRRGGAGLVRYRLDEEVALHGVAVGEALFRGYPVPGGAAGEYVAIFGIPRDAADQAPIRVFAADAAGNRADVGWPVRVLERKFDHIDIRLSQNFMGNKVPSLASELGIEGEGVPLFQAINHDERARNEDTIRGIVAASGDERFFEGAFVQMKNSAVTSQFAEHRTYLVGGNKVSEAIHYGYDLASVSGAPIEAGNAGVVLHAAPLGIYGNCVILDHGLGLTSLYAHLSQIDVKPGDRVARGHALGRSGATGLAGGDHLHFGIMAGASYVDPKEWWDEKWVREHVNPALP